MSDALAVREEQQAIGPILPLATPEGMTDAMKQYEALKRAVLSDADEQEITVKGKKRKFIKRSGWRRLSIAFGVSSTVLAHEITRGQDGRTVSAEFTIRATAPNGRFADGWGACSAWEERFQDERGRQKMEHDIPATAETRAENRACSNLFGYGEVSAEEMEDSPEVSKPTCPNCGKPVRSSTFAEGAWYCWKKGGGCGWQGTDPVMAETGEISPAKASPASQQALRAASDIPSNFESAETVPLAEPDGEVIQPPQRATQPAEPAKRRGRPLGSRNAAKGGVAVEPRSPATASEVGTPPQPPTGFGEEVSVEEGWLRELRSDIRKLASRLRKYQYMEQNRELPPIDLWNKEVERTLGIYIERKFGTEVVLEDIEEAGLQEALSELKGYIAKYESAEDESEGLASDAVPAAVGEREKPTPQIAPETTVVSLHKPIVRNPVAAQRRDPTAIDPKVALDRARALAELRNRTTALLAIREGKVNLSAQDEERLRGQADATMEKVAQNAFSKAIKELDVEQLQLLNDRAKAAAK